MIPEYHTCSATKAYNCVPTPAMLNLQSVNVPVTTHLFFAASATAVFVVADEEFFST